MKDVIANSMIGVAIAILLFMCLYAYIWQPYGQRMYLRGRNDVVGSMLVQLQQRQEVTINTQNGDIILTRKKAPVNAGTTPAETGSYNQYSKWRYNSDKEKST